MTVTSAAAAAMIDPRPPIAVQPSRMITAQPVPTSKSSPTVPARWPTRLGRLGLRRLTPGLVLPVLAGARHRTIGRAQVEAASLEHPLAVLACTLHLSAAPPGRHHVRADLIKVETVAAPNEFLQCEHEVRLV